MRYINLHFTYYLLTYLLTQTINYMQLSTEVGY